MGLVVFIASEEISTPTCSAKFISTVFCQLLEINFDENQMSGHLQEDSDPKHMSELENEWQLKHEIHRIRRPSMSLDLKPIENV